MFFRFDLTYLYEGTVTLTEQEQPRGISSVNSVLKRDFDSSGAFYRLTESDLKLDFPGIGKDILKSARDTQGVEAEVTLEIYERETELDSWGSPIYTGQAVMENLEINQDFASVDLRR